MRKHKDLYWQTTLDCDLEQLKSSVLTLDEWVNNNLTDNPDPLPDIFHIHDVYNNYNFFAYPLPQTSKLFRGVVNSFSQIESCDDMWIKAWVNVYNNTAHTWHSHKSHTWLDNPNHKQFAPSWHGIFCVVGDGTCTTYKNVEEDLTVHIPWQPNQLAFIENQAGWSHKCWKPKGDETRITIAFNILHQKDIDPFRYKNHWIPLTNY